MELVYESLNDQLRHRFPVLKQPQYTELIGGIEAGPYIVFGVLFNRYLADIATATDLQTRVAAASFMEELVTARDDRVSEMVKMEVLPTLLRSQAMVDSYWPVLGLATRRHLKHLGSRLSGKVELPLSEQSAAQ